MNENVTATNEAQETTQQTVDTASLQAQIDRLTSENAKLKNAQSNASADASKYKKALQDAEQRESSTVEQLQSKISAMERENAIGKQKASFMGFKFDEASAEKAAKAFFDKDFSSFSAVFKDFLTAHDKALLADAVRQTPRPGVGSTETAVTREQFYNMGYTDRVKLFTERPDLYESLTKKEE